jgi:hypothetical protein
LQKWATAVSTLNILRLNGIMKDSMSTNAVTKSSIFTKFLTDIKVIMAVRHSFTALAISTQSIQRRSNALLKG